MPPRESSYPADWYRIGKKELHRAKNLLGLNDLEGASYNIQQSLEKYLKGYLISLGWKLNRTHDLEMLLNEVVVHKPEFEKFRSACLKITEYYMEERYPFTSSSFISREEVEESLDSAEKIIALIIAE